MVLAVLEHTVLRFKRLSLSIASDSSQADTLTDQRLSFEFEGRKLEARVGDTVATALLACGVEFTRSTPVSGDPRSPFCLMGACFDCLIDIDNVPNQQAFGAGPAGLAACRIATELGIDALLIDEQRSVGGQIYRDLANADDQLVSVLGSEYEQGRALVTAVSNESVHWVHEKNVWNISQQAEIDIAGHAGTSRIQAEQVILATGALERAMPFPGWTLPGIMTAGALQIALKSSALVPDGPIVLAGSGPLLLLLARQLHDAGGQIEAIVDTTPASNWRRAWPKLVGFLGGGQLLTDGLKLVSGIRKRKIRHIKGVSSLKAMGDTRIGGLSFLADGHRQEIDCEHLAIHLGVVPNIQLTRLLGLEHQWQEDQRCWNPICYSDGSTSFPWLKLAGDGAGIFGAGAAAIQGEMAAVAAARDLSLLTNQESRQRMARLEKQRRPMQRARPFINALYAPSPEFLRPSDETIVCRCEEVTAADIRHYVDLGCRGPNQTKAFGRPGMGPCQGRFCGLTVSEIIAEKLDVTPEDVGYYRIRPPIKPITLAELGRSRPLGL